MTSLHVICGLNPTQSKILGTPMHQTMCIPNSGCCIFVLLRAPSLVVAYNIAKVQNILCVASSLKVFFFGMGWNMEENFSMEWKKISSMEYGKIIFHTMPCATLHLSTALRVSFMIMHIVC